MEIRQLEALVGIAENGTFSSAAEALGTVQSNISSRVARPRGRTGDRTGEPLYRHSHRVRRHRGGARPTNSRGARAIASDVSELNADIRGQVTLGMIGTAGRWIVPLLSELSVSDTRRSICASAGNNSALEPRLVNGQLDLAVLAFAPSWPIEPDRSRPLYRRPRGDRVA